MLFRDVAGISAQILSEEKQFEDGFLKCIKYTYTVYDEEYEVITGPFNMSVFLTGGQLSFILEL